MVMIKILIFNYLLLFMIMGFYSIFTGRWPDFTQDYLMPVFGVYLFIRDNV